MLTYDMEMRGDDTLYGYLYRNIREDILQGRIESGMRLPSKRKLATHLGIGVITVEAAYRQLVAEGYVEARERSGYYAVELGAPGVGSFKHDAARVSALAAHATREASPAASREDTFLARDFPPSSADAPFARISQDCTRSMEPHEKLIADFTGSSAATGIFPYAQWARTLRSVLSDETEESLVDASGPAGCWRLRCAIARYLWGFRGMRVDPEQIVIGAGAQVLYGLIVQLLGRDARYAIETPGYPRLAKIYRGNDVALDYLEMDEFGVSRAALAASAANVLHLMPSHQFPTGRVYPVSRRYELMSWASVRPDRWIVEDDFDCEFRLAGRPIPSLQSVDTQGCVIYTNTFTKSLGPAYRLGYMVLPPELARRFHDELGFYSCTVGTLDQLTLAAFLDSGDYERHVNRLRTLYRRIQESLLLHLRESRLAHAGKLSVEGVDAGLHFVLVLDDPRTEEELVALARVRGVALLPLSLFRMGAAAQPSDGPRRFVVNFTSASTENVRAAVAALDEAWML